MLNYEVKNKKETLILCTFLGITGAHHFYNKKYKKGILYLFTYGLFMIGWIYDIIKIIEQIKNNDTKKLDNHWHNEEKNENLNNNFKKSTYEKLHYVYYNNITNNKLVNNYVIMDIETTGLNKEKDKIIEFTLIKYVDNKMVKKITSLVNPRQNIPKIITEKTGITNDMISDKKEISYYLEEIWELIKESIIIGHNITFDLDFVFRDLANSKILKDDINVYYIDTLELSKKYIFDIKNYKLETLKEYLHIEKNSHRSENDCLVTKELYDYIVNLQKNLQQNKKVEFTLESNRKDYIQNIKLDDRIIDKKLKFAIKGKTKEYSVDELIAICKNNNIKAHNYFARNDYDYIVLSKQKYKNYLKADDKDYYDSHGKNIIDEYDFYNMLGLQYNKTNNNKINKVKAKDILKNTITLDNNNPFFNKECVFTGELRKMNRKESMQLIANLGGKNHDTVTKNTNFLIVGDDKNTKNDKSSKLIKAESLKSKGQDIEIISENVFYDMIDDYIEN